MSSGQDDLLLIDRSRAGDRSAFNDLVYKHEKRAYQYAFRLTQNPEEAADIVADSFVRVFNALPNFKGQSAFTTWLYRIVTNCYLDAKKKDKSSRQMSIDSGVSTEDGDREFQIEDTADGPVEIAETNEKEKIMQRALLKLPDYQRSMLIMYHVENLSYEDMAEALDLPIGTVKSRLNRARLGLRDQLSKDRELFLKS